MSRTASLLRALAGAAALAAVASGNAAAQAGVASNPVTVTLNATKQPVISLTATASSLTLPGGITDNSNANVFPSLPVTLDWTLTGGSTLSLVGWFATPASALANGTATIPSSRVEGKLSTSATWSAFTGNAVTAGANTAGVAGGSLVFDNIALAGNLTNSANRSLDLRLNLAGFGPTVAGDYTGTLNLRAIVQ
jgi:hypothetical protein